MANMERVGIFGGSFDPVHLGHLLVAQAAREEMGLDRLIFVPANRSPFKQANDPASVSLRMRMLRLALTGLSWCTLSEVEVERGGVSYTVDTVRHLASQLTASRLFLLIGEDNLSGLSDWKDAHLLKQMVEFLVIPRPRGGRPSVLEGITLHELKGWPLDLSSSVIRQRVRDGLSVDHLVPPGVADVIRHNRLYLP